MVAGILQEQDLAVTEAGDCGLHCRADAVVGCLYGLAEDLGEAVANGWNAHYRATGGALMAQYMSTPAPLEDVPAWLRAAAVV